VRISELAASVGVPTSTVRYYERVDIAERIAELEEFDAQLDTVRAELDAEAPPQACRADLTCCVPESAGAPVLLELQPRH
jgi:hypothetical protein